MSPSKATMQPTRERTRPHFPLLQRQGEHLRPLVLGKVTQRDGGWHSWQGFQPQHACTPSVRQACPLNFRTGLTMGPQSWVVCPGSPGQYPRNLSVFRERGCVGSRPMLKSASLCQMVLRGQEDNCAYLLKCAAPYPHHHPCNPHFWISNSNPFF
jgi:hypothetical protein